MGGLVELCGVGVAFSVGGGERPALRELSLTVGEAEAVSLRGPSGAGKSTLLSVIAGLVAPSVGRAFLDGEELSALDRRARARRRNRLVGFLFQTPHLLPQANLLDNVALPLLYGRVARRARRARAADALEQVGLGKRLLQAPADLAPGEQQRAALARALVTGPRIVLADEPTGDLSSTERRDLLAQLAALPGRGIALVIATHEPAVARVAARRILLSDGKIVAEER